MLDWHFQICPHVQSPTAFPWDTPDVFAKTLDSDRKEMLHLDIMITETLQSAVTNDDRSLRKKIQQCTVFHYIMFLNELYLKYSLCFMKTVIFTQLNDVYKNTIFLYTMTQNGFWVFFLFSYSWQKNGILWPITSPSHYYATFLYFMKGPSSLL